MQILKRCVFLAAGFTMAGSLWMSGQAPTAPAVDRVGFPKDYKDWTVLYVFDRPDNRQIRTGYVNDMAATVKNGGQSNYPYESVVVMEAVNALRDAAGNAVLDENGRFIPDPAAVPTVNVMRKGKGFGADYGPLRNGEWEYVAFRPDGTYTTPPQNSANCANCHLQAGLGKDYVFRASMRFNGASGAVPDGAIKNYKFLPTTMRVKAGAWVNIYNDDVIEHNLADDTPGGGVTERIKGGSSLTLKFDSPGEFNYHCAIHPNMKGTIIVEK